jgi:hypothetical protein
VFRNKTSRVSFVCFTRSVHPTSNLLVSEFFSQKETFRRFTINPFLPDDPTTARRRLPDKNMTGKLSVLSILAESNRDAQVSNLAKSNTTFKYSYCIVYGSNAPFHVSAANEIIQ